MGNKDCEIDYYIQTAKKLRATSVFLISPKDLIFDEKVLLKCFDCKNYGNKMNCPPNIPQLSYKELVFSYKKGLLICVKNNFRNRKEFNQVRKISSIKLLETLLDLEKMAFNQGNYFATSFMGGSCKLCDVCSVPCRYPEKARIPVEALGIDLVATLNKLGLKLEFPVKRYLYRVGLFLIK